MIAHKYDENGIYQGSVDCTIDPLESIVQSKNVYLKFPNSTNVSPNIQADMIPVWDGSKWNNKPDFRGKTIYNTETKAVQIMVGIGEIPIGFTLVTPLHVPYEKFNGSSWVVDQKEKLNYNKIQKRIEIQSAFENMFSIGLSCQTLNGGTIDCRRIQFQDEDDIGNIKTLLDVMKSRNIPTVVYRMQDNSGFPGVTQEMLESIIFEMGSYGVTQYQKRSSLNDDITSATDQSQLEKIKW